jgi:acyl carrier protein
MTETEIKAFIVSALSRIAPESDPASLRLDENIRAALDIDSFDFLSLLIALHDKTGVDIPEADYGKLVTLEGMIRYLTEKI